MFSKLQEVQRIKVKDTRNIKDGLLLNRAERVRPYSESELKNIINNIDFSKLGNYYNTDDFINNYSNYLGIKSNEILITSGAEEAIRYFFNVFLEKNDTVMFPIPTYGMYHVFCNIYSLNKITLEYNENFKINKKKLYNNLEKVKVFFLPQPSHIEDIFEKEEITNICKILKNNDGILVVDETYFGYGCSSVLELIKDFSNIYIIRSFSKTLGLPSIRVGCIIGSSENINVLSNFRPAYEISYPSLKIAEYFLDKIHLTNLYIEECCEGRSYLISKLQNNNIEYNGKSNYLINIKIKNKNICDKIYTKLEKKNIYTRKFEDYISITIGPMEYMKIFFKNFLEIYKEQFIQGEFKFLFEENTDGTLKYIATENTFNDIYKNNINAWNQNINDEYLGFARKKIIEFIEINQKNNNKNKLLEIGCGNGFSTNYFNENLENICYGCDISEFAVKEAQKKYKNINFFCQDIRQNILIKDKFDTIIFSDIIWYILDDLEKCIKNSLVNLKEDGIIIFNNSMIINQRYGKVKIDGSRGLFEYFKNNFNVVNTYESVYIDRRKLCIILIKK